LAWNALGPNPQANVVISGTDGVSSVQENVSGRVSALAVSPNYDGHGNPAIFAGTASGGIFRTTQVGNNNPNWAPVSDDITYPSGGALSPEDAAGAVDIGCITVDPNHPNRIYAGTGEANFSSDSRYGAGILWSDDGGTTWELVSAPNSSSPNSFFRESIAKIIVDPTDPSGNSLFAAVAPAGENGFNPATDRETGVWRSRNGGKTWNQLRIGNGRAVTVTDLEYTVYDNPFSGTSQLNLYAGLGNVENLSTYDNSNNGIWQSFDAGNSWDHLALPNPGNDEDVIGRISLASDHRPSFFPSVVFAAVSLPSRSTSDNPIDNPGTLLSSRPSITSSSRSPGFPYTIAF
jgi:hypothetical protein